MFEVTYSPKMAEDKELFPLVENATRYLQGENSEPVPEVTAHWDAVQSDVARNLRGAVLKLKNDVIEQTVVVDRKTLNDIARDEGSGSLFGVMARFFLASASKRIRILKETEIPVGA